MTLPSFADFYRAVHDRSPFPWQERLAGIVLADGWPRLLDLPTGAGKTSALDVALYALAAASNRMPRRTVLVVDRRIVVDQAAEHASHVLTMLKQAADGPAAEVARRLRQLSNADPGGDPFQVTVMRGGMPRDYDWASRPDRPVVGLSTVDQVGSRLFFRGYGLSDRSRPIHAGLLANDTLILLDEVHLAAPFADTLRALDERYRKPGGGLPNRFAIVEMSATPGLTRAKPFTLDADDCSTPALAQRLSARKLVTLVDVPVPKDAGRAREVVARRAVEHAVALQTDERPTVAIVLNRVESARLALRQLSAARKTTDALLITGRMRPIDRDALVGSQLLPRAGAARNRESHAARLVVVATQTIEAGADLDFDGMVTQCASLDALKQRFGRVDRRGARGETANVLLGPSQEVSSDAQDPIYGAALAATWDWLRRQSHDGTIDFGIDGLDAVVPQGESLVPLLSDRPRAPVLLPTHLDAWAQTSPRPACEPNVALWLHGMGGETADVSIVWRADIAESMDPRLVQTLLAAVRPSSLEAVTLPIGVARAWFEGRTVPMADTVFNPDEVDDDGAAPTAARRPFLWAGDESRWIGPGELRPGQVLVVPAHWGGLRAANFDPESVEAVADLAEVAALRSRGRATLRLNRAILTAWGLSPEVVDATPQPLDDPELARDLLGRIKEWAASWPPERPVTFAGTDSDWATLRQALGQIRRKPVVIGGVFVATDVGSRTGSSTVEDAVSEDDDSAFRADQATLTKHMTDVAERTGAFASALGLPEALRNDLVLAASVHDLGKADPRFQAWLLGGVAVGAANGAALLAKSALPPGRRREREEARRRASYPSGCRHELLSVSMIQDNGMLSRANDADLVLHLVGSHHGWCRPFPPFLDDPDDLEVVMANDGDTFKGRTRHGLARLDSGVAGRYWMLVERYGRWGLAWLEAILRLADHRVSQEGEA